MTSFTFDMSLDAFLIVLVVVAKRLALIIAHAVFYGREIEKSISLTLLYIYLNTSKTRSASY
jgi:hypothetical protein